MDNGKSQLNVLFDLGSDWITLPTKNCTSCTGGRSANNGSYVALGNLTGRTYGSAQLNGFNYQDYVCFTTDMSTCASVTYFGMVNQTGLNPKVDGVIGLSQNSPFIGDVNSYSPHVGPLFMDALKQNQVIQTDIFSLCMRGYKGDQSSIDFGQP